MSEDRLMIWHERVVWQAKTEEPLDVVTPTGMALILAYIHKMRPAYLDRKRLFRARDLRAMLGWLGQPQTDLRGVREHRQLAAYVVLLEGLGLWEHTAVGWYVSPVWRRVQPLRFWSWGKTVRSSTFSKS